MLFYNGTIWQPFQMAGTSLWATPSAFTAQQQWFAVVNVFHCNSSTNYLEPGFSKAFKRTGYIQPSLDSELEWDLNVTA